MNLDKKKLLTPNEITFILIGIMLDISVQSLPNSVVEAAKQDGWISAAIGALYPFYVALIAIYISGKFPEDNILVLSKRYMGKYLGGLLNLLFFLSFISYFPPLLSLLQILIRTEVLQDIAPLNILAVVMLVGAYAASKGIKVIGRICVISFVFIIVILLPSLAVIPQGSLLNIRPVFGSGVVNIIKGSEASVYDYSLIEIIFLIYPFINDRSKIKRSVLMAVGYSCIIYTWITFITIYYVGEDIIPKTLWSFITVTEGVKIEIINSFRFVFIFFWMFIAVKSTAIFSYLSVFFLEQVKELKNKKVIQLIIAIIVITITIKYYGDLTARGSIIKYTSRISTIYNLFYITLIAIFISIKKEVKHEKK